MEKHLVSISREVSFTPASASQMGPIRFLLIDIARLLAAMSDWLDDLVNKIVFRQTKITNSSDEKVLVTICIKYL